MKKLEIEKTKPTFIISTFKTDIIKVGLVFSISNFFIAKTSLANNWRSFSSSYLALFGIFFDRIHRNGLSMSFILLLLLKHAFRQIKAESLILDKKTGKSYLG